MRHRERRRRTGHLEREWKKVGNKLKRKKDVSGPERTAEESSDPRETQTPIHSKSLERKP